MDIDGELAAQWVTAVAAVFALLLSAGSLYYVKGTLKQTRDGVAIAYRTLFATERPWLFIEPAIDGDLFIRDGKPTIPITFTITNLGRSPALNTKLYTEFFLNPMINPGREPSFIRRTSEKNELHAILMDS